MPGVWLSAPGQSGTEGEFFRTKGYLTGVRFAIGERMSI